MRLPIPAPAAQAIRMLGQAGFEAFAVGGCVRDSLMGRTPDDWDITTAALPEGICRVFRQYRVIPTGMKHGTVTVVLDGMPLEITTYRVDGAYADGRHPDLVSFTRCLEEDLSRRDFTVNALAYHPETGLVDLFGGQRDLQDGVLRCVGDPLLRFREDALRILRALRFSAVLGLSPADETAKAIHTQRERLKNISAERVQSELCKLVCGRDMLPVLLAFPDVLTQILPELAACVDFDQQNPYHIYTVWEHSVRAAAQIDPDPALRLSMLLHDCGKPACFTKDEKGGHFYGHAQESAARAKEILTRLRFDKKTAHRILTLIQYHDVLFPPTRRAVRRWLGRLGPAAFFDLIRVKQADTRAQAPAITAQRLESLEQLRRIAEEILQENACLTLRGLAVNGSDLIAAGIPQGKDIGVILHRLLEAVTDETCPNEKDALLTLALSGKAQ